MENNGQSAGIDFKNKDVLLDVVKRCQDHPMKEHLEQAIKILPLKQKTVFLLHDVQGFTHTEIAQITKFTEGTSKSQLFKARMKSFWCVGSTQCESCLEWSCWQGNPLCICPNGLRLNNASLYRAIFKDVTNEEEYFNYLGIHTLFNALFDYYPFTPVITLWSPHGPFRHQIIYEI